MKYFDIDSKNGGEIVDEYIQQFEGLKDHFPLNMSIGEKMLAWLLIVNIHAIAETIEDEEEEWKN